MTNTQYNANTRMAIISHIIPFVLWVGLMSLPMQDVALRYAIQMAVSLVAFLALRPWRYYSGISIRSLPLGVLVGVGVAVVWILPESAWIRQFPDIYEFYVRYFIRGSDPGTGQHYAPEQCGWLLSVIKLAGSACVIAVIEEYFWRGFFMRWLVKTDFLSVDPRTVGRGLFFLTALAFGFEHNRWLVGVMAGLAYGWLYCRKGDMAAVSVAHVTTNYLLGLYVLATGSYSFW